jgi:hypothetical protein
VLKKIAKHAPVPLVYASSYLCNRKMISFGTNYIREGELAQLVRVPFEDMKVAVPQGWDACLRRQYGNYMQLPPVEKQKGHHSEALPDPFTPCNHAAVLHWNERTHLQLQPK